MAITVGKVEGRDCAGCGEHIGTIHIDPSECGDGGVTLKQISFYGTPDWISLTPSMARALATALRLLCPDTEEGS